MKTLEELVALRDSIDAIEMSTLTVGEACKLFNQLHQLEQQIHFKQSQQRSDSVQSTFESIPYTVGTNRSEAAPPKRRLLSDQHVGRYVMTVLAAGLCLLALGVFITSFWAVLPDVAKFLVLLFIGIALEGIGMALTSRGKMHPFWLGIAGLGASTIMLVLVAGCVFWYICDLIAFGALVLIWFAVNFIFATKQAAGVFYVIAYIGGAIATAMLCAVASGEFLSEVVLIFLIGPILAMGFGWYFKTRHTLLLYINLLYCWLSSVCVIESFQTVLLVEKDVAHFARYTPTVLLWYLVACNALCLWFTQFLGKQERWRYVIRNAATVYISALFISTVCYAANSSIIGYIVAAIIMCLAIIHSCSGYYLGIAIPLTSVLSLLSSELTSRFNAHTDVAVYTCGALLPCLLALLLCTATPRRSDKFEHSDLLLFLACAAWHLVNPTFKVEPVFYIFSAVLFMAAVIVFVTRITSSKEFLHQHIEYMFFALTPCVVVSMLGSMEIVPRITTAVVASVILQVFDVVYLRKVSAEEQGVVWLVHSVLRVIVYILLMCGALFIDTPSKVLLTIAVMCTTIYNIWQFIYSRVATQAIVSCILANWHLFFLLSLWSLSLQLPISMAGLIIGVVFIAMGFKVDSHAIRQCGHWCCIVYALKMGLFDATAGGLGTAGGLLIAGLICFCVSLAYNKVEKMKTTTGSDSDKESP